MSPLLYLFTKKTKNRFMEFIRKPSHIITALIICFFLGFTFYTSSVSTPSADFFRDKEEFFAIVFALYSFAFIMTAKNGFVNGASMFSMADVNLLFTSPFKEKRVLTYGLFQQLGKSLTPGIFILYQSSLANNIYGIEISALFYVLIGYGATVFLSQLLAMVIYSLTCSDDRKCLLGKIVFYGTFAVFIGIILLNSYDSGFNLKSIVSASRDRIMYFFPVSGFISFAVEGAITGEGKYIISGVMVFLLLCAAYYLAISKINKDFYEDVLKATEVSFSTITARKEGKAAETAPRNVKVGKTGITKGFGASVLSEKHRIENRRSNRFIISTTGLLMIGFSVLYSFIFRGETVALFAINIYTMSMSVCAGRWAKEFTFPYVYLIPEKPFKKLLYLIKEDLPSMAAESLLCFVPLIVSGSCNIMEGIAMTAARFTFGLMFIGINLLLQRFLGDSDKKVFSLILYMVFVMLFSVPSVAVGIFTGTLLPFNHEIAYLVMAVLNFGISFLLIFSCRNVLEYSEFNNR